MSDEIPVTFAKTITLHEFALLPSLPGSFWTRCPRPARKPPKWLTPSGEYEAPGAGAPLFPFTVWD